MWGLQLKWESFGLETTSDGLLPFDRTRHCCLPSNRGLPLLTVNFQRWWRATREWFWPFPQHSDSSICCQELVWTIDCSAVCLLWAMPGSSSPAQRGNELGCSCRALLPLHDPNYIPSACCGVGKERMAGPLWHIKCPGIVTREPQSDHCPAMVTQKWKIQHCRLREYLLKQTKEKSLCSVI